MYIQSIICGNLKQQRCRCLATRTLLLPSAEVMEDPDRQKAARIPQTIWTCLNSSKFSKTLTDPCGGKAKHLTHIMRVPG